MQRDIIVIDEARCDGCGHCVTACAEGAIAVVNGKAKLVSEVYCDGLGACLGHCPQGAITVVKREAPAFDQQAVDDHLAAQRKPAFQIDAHQHHACPGSMQRSLAPGPRTPDPGSRTSQLGHWPVQLGLVNPGAPFLAGADLLLTAHCVPVAMPDFHQRWVGGRGVLLACPKLDDLARHTQKLTAILAQAKPASLTVLRMEVPCCGGLAWAAKQAAEAAGWNGRLEVVTVPITPVDRASA
ncbi:MAG: 4Fe-4S ferredoxin [Planctomycetes bacterium]|nr:4Fe-4S ferredoxin [Planctomycetota bacterium]